MSVDGAWRRRTHESSRTSHPTCAFGAGCPIPTTTGRRGRKGDQAMPTRAKQSRQDVLADARRMYLAAKNNLPAILLASPGKVKLLDETWLTSYMALIQAADDAGSGQIDTKTTKQSDTDLEVSLRREVYDQVVDIRD